MKCSFIDYGLNAVISDNNEVKFSSKWYISMDEKAAKIISKKNVPYRQDAFSLTGKFLLSTGSKSLS